MANWLIGQEVVEEEQRGKRRAGYGQQLLQELSLQLTVEFGKGFSVDNLELYRRFFLEYPGLLSSEKSDALRRKSSKLLPGTNLGGLASFTQIFPGRTTADCSVSITLGLARFMRSKLSKTTGRPANWSGR